MISIFHNITDLKHLRNGWNELAYDMGNPLLTMEWFECAISALHNNDSLYIFCLIQDNELTAAAPLYQDSTNKVSNRLKIIGHQRLGEPTSLLYKSAESLAELMLEVKSTGLALMLNRLSVECVTLIKNKNYAPYGISHILQATDSQHLILSDTFHNFEKSLSSKRRSDIRRATKKATGLGKVDVKIFEPKQSDVSDYLDIVFDIENSGWKNETKTSVRHNTDLETFYRCIFKVFTKYETAIIGLLLIDNIPVSCNISVRFNNKLWVLKIGYNENYRACSPGILLLHEMIKYCHKNDMNGFEFLGSSEEWIRLWQPNNNHHATYMYYPLTYSGIRFLIIDGLYIIKSRFIPDIITKLIMKPRHA